ncbi:uncharacterized protein [Drosophila kikkawai]|uniref:Uncharacterized protein isoform X2 n=1 Tax=Drosophila kikkawai TaxID=30033 RepID=A0A6P4JFA8_DROKI|nr:uncharacterized protein LOC108082577 isoform X2 [Drosophila kikkawai]
MEHFFSLPVPRMSIGMIQPVEYSPLNPNALEFVPSHRQNNTEIHSINNIETKTEATSTTTLSRPEIVGDAVNHVENGYSVQRQIFECLSQLGDEQMPLEEVGVTLLPGGRGLSMRFTTKQKPGQLFQPPDPNDPIYHKGHSLQLDVSDPKKLDNRPESVLVAQFLFRVNDLLREKYEDGGDASICPKCTLCSNRSYTELEIEHQIEGIKAFENFTFTESTRYQDLVSHKAFQELCRKLGLIVSRDQIHINRASSGQSPTASPPPPSAQTSVATVSIDDDETVTEMETDVEAYAGDDEQQFNGHDLTPKGSTYPETSTKYVRGKLYRYDNSEGSQFVNQLTEMGSQCSEPTTGDPDNSQPSTPVNPMMASSMPTQFPRVYKTAKARCSVRGAGASLQSGSQNRRATPYNRPPVQNPQATLTTIQRCRLTAGGGQCQATAAAGEGCPKARKLHAETCLPAPTRKQNYQRATAPKSELGCQQAGAMKANSVAGRLPRQGRQPSTQPKPTSNHLCSKATAQGPTSKQQHATAQRMIPRSTTTSLMRQSEVKRVAYEPDARRKRL